MCKCFLNTQKNNYMSSITNTLRSISAKHRVQMNQLLSLTKSLINNEKKGEDEKQKNFEEFFKQCAPDLRILIEVLYYGGKWIYDENIDLTTLSLDTMTQEEFEKIQKGFDEYCCSFMARQRLSFGEPLDGVHFNVSDGMSSAWKVFLLPAIVFLGVAGVRC